MSIIRACTAGSSSSCRCSKRRFGDISDRSAGHWKYLYRAVDKQGNTVDFLPRAHRDKAAARRYFEKAIDQNGEPETVTVDKSGANLAALEALNATRPTPIKIRQNKYLNNVVEQDHRAIKRIVKPMMGFKNFRCARIILTGIEIMHVIRKARRDDIGRRADERRVAARNGSVFQSTSRSTDYA
jgi:transposase-like protein